MNECCLNCEHHYHYNDNCNLWCNYWDSVIGDPFMVCDYWQSIEEEKPFTVTMGGLGSGKRYALEQLLNVAIAENERFRDCIKQQKETLQEYEKAMQQMTAERNRIINCALHWYDKWTEAIGID